MKTSGDIKQALLRFYDRRSAADTSSFESIVSKEVKIVLGTTEGEWFLDREKLRGDFGKAGLRVESDSVLGFEEGTMGWAVDKPTLQGPNGYVVKTRLSVVFRHEDGEWKIVHMHFSVGVPDEEVVALQKKWLSQATQ